MEVIKIAVIILLGIVGIIDLKYKKVNLLLIAAFGIIGIGCQIIYKTVSPISMIGGMAIGIILIVISIATKEKVGKGDGFILLVTGIFLGFFDNLFLLLTAVFLTALAGIILLIIKKVSRDYEIPFIPFLFISFIGDCILWS